jgi:predicted hydrocarbon binding protein
MDMDTRLPNNMMHFILTQFDSTMGANGTRTVLNYSGLSRLIDNYPPRDFNPGEPLTTFFSLIAALLEIYGEKGYRALLRDVGKKTFYEMKAAFPWLFEVEGSQLTGLSPGEQFALTYKSYVEKMSKMFDAKTSLDLSPHKIIDTAFECIWCMGLKSRGPICIFTEDFYTAMAESMGVSSIKVVETQCTAAGDKVCVFITTFE